MRSPMVIIAYLTASLCLPSFFFSPLPSTKHCLWNLLQSKLYVKICFQGKPLCGIMWSILSIKCLQEIDNSISTGLNNKKTLLSHVTWSPEVGLLQGSLIQWLTKTIQSPKFLSFSSAILSMVALYLSLAFLTLTKWITWRQQKGKDWYFPGESFLRPRHPFPERVTSGWPPFSHWPEMGLTSPSNPVTGRGMGWPWFAENNQSLLMNIFVEWTYSWKIK